jgi:hypothetical protein
MSANHSNNQIKQLVRYLNFHLHPHASFYNTIDGIIFYKDFKKTIADSMDILKNEYSILDYKNETDFSVFLENLANLLSQDKVVFINLETLKLHPIIYDQLIQIREKNSFNIRLNNNCDLSLVKIHPNSKIFLIYQQTDNQSPNSEILNITDHLLDLRKF